MLVTLSGMTMDVRPQPQKASLPILVTPLEIVIEVRLLQFRKVQTPIFVTPEGMFTEVRLVQKAKA